MRPRNVTLIVIGLLLIFLVLANWSVFSQATEINLLLLRVHAPLGLLFILVALAVFAIDFTLHSLNRMSWSRERRDLTAQIERHRQLADQAEESRVRALGEKIERESSAIRAQLDALSAQLRAQR
jgi:uncharacterized integral membrane protein